jgi:hypothetical protein
MMPEANYAATTEPVPRRKRGYAQKAAKVTKMDWDWGVMIIG